MIKRLRLKFIVINMGIATILLSAILGLVFYFTSANLETESIRMMAVSYTHLTLPTIA